MSDTTPTPPADTRQQAAEDIARWQAGDATVPSDSVPEAEINSDLNCAFDLGQDYPEYGDRDLVEAWKLGYDSGATAGLASSSPALPEPPAPSSTGVDNTTWHPVFSASVVADWSLGGVWSFGPDRRMTPAEARLLASTLLAAADVAEEQQP